MTTYVRRINIFLIHHHGPNQTITFPISPKSLKRLLLYLPQSLSSQIVTCHKARRIPAENNFIAKTSTDPRPPTTMGYRQVAGIMLSPSDSRSSDDGMCVPRMVPGYQEKITIHQWSCDVCKSAVFDNYDDASNHEILCRYKQEQRLRFYHDREKSPESIDIQERPKKIIRDDYPVNATNPTESPRNISSTKKPSKKQRWICDVCRVAKFHSYVDAYVHERNCIQLQGDVAQEQEQRDQLPNNSSKRHHSPSKRRQQLEERGTKNKSVKWLCSVCEVACFDDYDKACDHEARCTRL
jgi:hypothetical protein